MRRFTTGMIAKISSLGIPWYYLENIQHTSITNFNCRYYAPSPEVTKSNFTFVIIHGGFWKQAYDIDNSYIIRLVPFLTSRGHGAIMLEYRRREHPLGGWPGTNTDIADSFKVLAEKSNEVKFIMNFEQIMCSA